MTEELNSTNKFELFFDNLISIYNEFLSEDYKKIETKIVCIQKEDKWNIVYFSLELTSNEQDLRNIKFSENEIILLYKKIINIDDFAKNFTNTGGKWAYNDEDFEFLFIYPISFDKSIDTLRKRIECNHHRQRISSAKQIHIEYLNLFGTTATRFSYNPFYDEDFIDENRNLIRAEKVVRTFLGYKIDGLCTPAIFIIYPIESFNFSKNIIFQESMINLSLVWNIKEDYQNKIMPTYKKDDERKILAIGENNFQIPYDYTDKIEIKINTRPNFLACSSKEELFQETLTFPDILIFELIKKIEIVDSFSDYSKVFEIVKNIIHYRGLDLRSKIGELKPDALKYYMGGNDYGETFFTLPENKKKLHDKKRQLENLLETIIKPKKQKIEEHSQNKISIKTSDSDMDKFLFTEINKNLKNIDLPKVRLKHFIDLLAFLVNKMIYNQNYKEFLQDKADKWFEEHKNDIKIDMETKFFQPFIREKLREKYGEECVDTPDEVRGHIDLKLSFTIPIELKVFKDDKSNDISGIELLEKEHLGQFEGEIINTRVGFLIGLDYRKSIKSNLTTMLNREYIKFIWKIYPNSNSLIVLLIFSANKKSPSKL